MCGIAGIIKDDAEVYKEHLNRMIDSLRHRGPDDSGIHFFQKCAVGHTRLSIVDLSTGHQPMLTRDKQVAVTFNGEIYGFRDIKAKLSDYPFRTTSDAEVILALYQKHGEDLLSYLPGMFAFAIWDDSQQKLFCARDRFGEKPFFYAIGNNGEFIFASEIKALLASGLITPILSLSSVIHYMKRLYVHPHKTIYENVHVLPPAHKLSYKDGHLKVERYWQLPETNDTIAMSEAVEQFRKLFEKAVKQQLIADVPVGAFLSGGLDSSTVTALASKHKSNLKTLSFGFEGNLSELPYAGEVANQYKTEHSELSADNVNIGELLLEMQDIYDEPFADSSNIPTYLICKLASQYVKSVITGDGGDELLAGYSYWYKPLLLMERESGPSIWRVVLTNMIAKFSVHLRLQNKAEWKIKANALQNRRQYGSITHAHNAQNIYFSDKALLRLGLDTDERSVQSDHTWKESDTVDDALRMDVENYLPGDILVKTDRASMANGLELRTPFLDVDFASFCLSLPSRLKINSENDKLILREVYSDLWPKSVRTRSKQGFGAPVTQWLKMKSVRALKDQYLNDPKKKIFKFISFEQSRHIINKDDYQTWILLVLSIWMEKHEFE
jgi:asparagine synthase (glutamine-hydrolysing)